jgi:endonuclease/exonuclease/phosphatase family metal-dependent hydrolase
VIIRIVRSVLALSLFLLPLAVSAQTVTPVGSPEQLDVATWNIEWFGSSTNGPGDVQRQFNNVRRIIEAADIDLWAVQEISNPNMFRALLDSLGEGYDGRLATYTQTQKIGFIYRTDAITPQATMHVLSQYSSDFAGRPPLELRATVTLPDTSVSVTFLVVHLKAFSTPSDHEQRRRASLRLQTYVDAPQDEESFVVLGDFNDQLTTSTTPGLTSPFTNFLDETHRYRFLTLDAEERGETSWTGSQNFEPSMIDHILVTSHLFDAYVPESAQVWSTLPRTFIGFTTTTSDHLPVYASFDFRTINSADAPVFEFPVATRIESVYPNPTSGPVTVDVSFDRPSDVRVDVVDVAGREIALLMDGHISAGVQQFSAALEGVASGLYFVRVRTDSGLFMRPVALVR